jgi:hypothetical protein
MVEKPFIFLVYPVRIIRFGKNVIEKLIEKLVTILKGH